MDKIPTLGAERFAALKAKVEEHRRLKAEAQASGEEPDKFTEMSYEEFKAFVDSLRQKPSSSE